MMANPPNGKVFYTWRTLVGLTWHTDFRVNILKPLHMDDYE